MNSFEGDALLSFPLTPFGADGEVDHRALAEHVRRQIDAGPSALFVACGTGEFPALDADEVAGIVRTTVDAAAGRLPVFCGAGGGPRIARGFVRAARESGSDGVLLLPPYLVAAAGRGLIDHVRYVTQDEALPVILYQRANAVVTPAAAVELLDVPTVIGVKDGIGDIDAMVRVVTTVRASGHDRAASLLFMNGLPTAEVSARPYRAIGVPAYSSAVLNFAPDIASAFWRALTSGDASMVDSLLAAFYVPFAALRDVNPGYAVSLVKCGARLAGFDVGPVRPPLLEPTPDEADRLAELIATARHVIAQAAA